MSLEKGDSLEIKPIDNAPSLAINSVTTLAPGSQATVVNAGTPQNALLDIAIPQGVKGDQGDPGTPGTDGNDGADATNPNFTIGTVTSLAPGSTPTVAIDAASVYPNLILNFGLVRGDTGSGSTVAWGDITGTFSAQTDLQNALSAKAPLNSPTFTGSVNAPTPTAGDNDTSVATTAFVQGELADLLTDTALTGTPTAPTALAGTNTTQIATTAFVHGAVASLAPLDSPVFTGDPRVPAAPAGDNDTSIASTAWVTTKLGNYAPLAGAALTGDPTADGSLIGYRNLPTSRTVSSNVNLADSDKGKKILVSGNRTITLQPNSTVAIDTDAIGTIVNTGTGTITIARGTGVTAKLMGTGADANRSIAAGGVATWMKVATNDFFIGGPGVS